MGSRSSFQRPVAAWLTVLAVIAVAACSPAATATPTPAPTPTTAPRVATPTTPPTPTAAPATPTATPVLAAPTPTRTPTPAPPTTTGGPVRGGTLNMPFKADPTRLDPTAGTQLDNERPIHNMAANLTRSLPNQWMEIAPDLAESWQISGGGTVYTFKLRPGLTWGDGKPITAADADYTFSRWLKLPNKMPFSAQACVRDVVTGTRAVDTLTFEITLKEPRSSFLGCITQIYVKLAPKHIAEPIDAAGGRDFTLEELAASTAGPFKSVKYERGGAWYLTRNPDYYLWKSEGRPYVDNLNFYVLATSANIVAALRSGQIHQSSYSPLLTPEQGDELKQGMGDKIVVVSGDYTAVTQLSFNTNIPPFNDRRIRKAVDLAIDRQALCSMVWGNRCTYVFPFFADWAWIYPRSHYMSLPGWRQPKTADIAEAKRLIAEATGGKGLTVTATVPATSYYPDTMMLIQQQLREINVNLTLQSEEANAALDRFLKGDFVLAIQGHGVAYLDPDAMIDRFYIASGARNFAKWEDPRVVTHFQAERTLGVNAERAPHLRQIADIVLEEAPYAWVVRDPRTMAWSSEMKGLDVIPGSNLIELRQDFVWLKK